VTQIGDVATQYLQLALRLCRLEPGLVECYTGPASLQDAVEAEPPPTAKALHDSIAMLLDDGRSEEEMRSCRRFVAGDTRRFQRLLGEQLTPRDLDGQR
jgi:hypothetical protein